MSVSQSQSQHTNTESKIQLFSTKKNVMKWYGLKRTEQNSIQRMEYHVLCVGILLAGGKSANSRFGYYYLFTTHNTMLFHIDRRRSYLRDDTNCVLFERMPFQLQRIGEQQKRNRWNLHTIDAIYICNCVICLLLPSYFLECNVIDL